MIEEKEVLSLFADIRRETLYVWIERGWLAPEAGDGGFRFCEIDVARVRLIREFRTELELDVDALDVILPLLDQVHGLRDQVRRLADAVSREPEDVRRRIGESLARQPDRSRVR
jgi:chaperone modulatory protein CbpM